LAAQVQLIRLCLHRAPEDRPSAMELLKSDLLPPKMVPAFGTR
jgi:hypothetical protein